MPGSIVGLLLLFLTPAGAQQDAKVSFPLSAITPVPFGVTNLGTIHSLNDIQVDPPAALLRQGEFFRTIGISRSRGYTGTARTGREYCAFQSRFGRGNGKKYPK